MGYVCDLALRLAPYSGCRRHVGSFSMLDAQWYHIPHPPIAALALRDQARSRRRDVQDRSLSSCYGDVGSLGYRSEEHTSELQSHSDLVCRLLLEKKKKII